MKPTEKPQKANPQPQRPAAPRPKAGEKIPGTVPVRFTAILYNVLGLVVSAIFISALFDHHDPDPQKPGETEWNMGYDWLKNSMLASNLDIIEKNPDKTVKEKYEMKWGQGGVISYTYKIKESTPDSAIILMPTIKTLKDIGFKDMSEIPWISYFLYPRRIVYEDSIKSPLYARANYVVAVNGWGMDKIKYQVEKPEPFMVLPINK